MLGRLARAALAADQILDVGREAGAQSGALALVDSTLAIDLGRQADVATGDIALCGRRVFGKITEVGAQTSIVRRASEPGYRDVVQLAQSVDGVLHFGPRGLFEGTGEPKARIRQVSATEKVEKGWLVFTTGHAGLSPQPLLYGVVARAERQPGAAHWEISVDLAAGADDPTHLLVLRARVNPARLAGAETEAQ